MKKLFRRSISLAISAVLIAGLCACGGGSSDSGGGGSADTGSSSVPTEEQEITLSLASFFGTGNQHEAVLVWICNQMYERSGGTIKTDYYASGTLLSSATMLDGIKSGVADIGIVQPGDYTGRFPEIGLAETPGISFTSAAAYGRALTEYYETYQPAELDGVKVLGFEAGCIGVLASNVGPIRHPTDLSGQTIRALGNPAKSVAAFGATATDVAIADCYESLRTGVIDGIMTLTGSLDSFKLAEVIDHAYNYTLYNSSAIWIMNEDTFNKLSDRQKEAVLSTWSEASEYMLNVLPDDIYCCESLPAAMNSIEDYYYPTAEETAEFAELLAPIVDEQVAALNEQGYDGDEILERWLTLAEKYNAEYPISDPSDPDYVGMTYPDTGERVITDGITFETNY